jgi:ammonia channel protein AmtB
MKCYVHPDADSVGTCTSCGRAICRECAVDVQGKLICRDCLARGRGTISKYDPNTVFLVELIAGFFGLLGIGYILAGRTNEGITRLILWLLYDIIAVIVITALAAIIVGIICIPIQFIIQVAVPLWSANKIKNELLAGTPI